MTESPVQSPINHTAWATSVRKGAVSFVGWALAGSGTCLTSVARNVGEAARIEGLQQGQHHGKQVEGGIRKFGREE